MRLLLPLAALVFLTGCPHKAGQRCMEDLHYFKDTRAGVCYATCGSSASRSFSFTYVPCTDEVEKAVEYERRTD